MEGVGLLMATSSVGSETKGFMDFAAVAERMAEAVIVARWGTEYDPHSEDAVVGLTEEQWAQARAGNKAATQDEMAEALSWLLDNPLAFLDAYGERRADA